MFAPVRMIVMLDHEKEAKIMNSSPIRLIVGGSAKLVKLASSHHIVIKGRIDCRPRAKSIVRLWIRS